MPKKLLEAVEKTLLNKKNVNKTFEAENEVFKLVFLYIIYISFSIDIYICVITYTFTTYCDLLLSFPYVALSCNSFVFY